MNARQRRLSRLLLSLLFSSFYVINSPVASDLIEPESTTTHSGEGLRCIKCHKCELGVYVAVCKETEFCYSFSELSEKDPSLLGEHLITELGSFTGQFDNITTKGCTDRETFCDAFGGGFPCYTCNWNLCNPEIYQPYPSGRSSRVNNNQWIVFIFICIAACQANKSSGF